MTGRSDTERFLDAFLAPERTDQLSERVLQAALSDIARTPQRRVLRVPWRFTNMPVMYRAAAAGLALVVLAGAGGVIYLNSGGFAGGPNPTATPSPTPSASPTVAAAPSGGPPSDCVEPTPQAGTLLGCSSDGTRLLIQKGDLNLFVLHADGSETQVTEQLSGTSRFLGSARPAGATISPDGSRVVFAGLTKPAEEALSCHDGALFAVDADGGPAELLWQSQAADEGGIVKYPTFSPDGTQIALVDGYCDNNHSVWVMNADGTDAHQIVTRQNTPLGGGYAHGLAWSAAGDRIALKFQAFWEPGTVIASVYTFAPDGSDFTAGGDVSKFCWPGRHC